MVSGKTDEKKLVTRAQTDGSGIYSCTQGECAKDPFTTRDQKEFEDHGRESKRHYQQGAGLCAVCGQSVDMNVVITKVGNKPLHPECRGEPEEL